MPASLQSVLLDRPSHTQSNICFGKITSAALRVGRQEGREHCYGRVIIATKGNGRKEHETVFSEIYFALWMEYLMTYQSARDCTGLQRCTLPYQQFALLLQRHDILEAINNLKTEELFFLESVSLCQDSRLRPLVLLIKVV